MNRNAPDREPTDSELVQRAQAGAPAAFAELVSRYQDRIYNTCYRMCHNDADALDLTQTTFMRALEHLDRFRRDANFYTWIYRIAVNLTLSARRARTRRGTHSLGANNDGWQGYEPPDQAPHVGAAVERDEVRSRVEAALAALDDEFRAPVVLKDIEGLDYASIADILEVPLGTVKSRIHRGRLLLRDLLAEKDVAVDRRET